MAVDVDEALPL
ncbi:hypothetical protein BN1723_016351, partial [Verticillium longisporum]